MGKRLVFLAVVLGSILSMSMVAQTTATISGTVYDQGGGVVPGAEIVITNMDTQQNRSVKTDSSGLFYVPALNSGTYRVTASAPGFGAVVESNIGLTVGLQQTLNFTLKPSQLAEKVEVQGDAPVVHTSS